MMSRPGLRQKSRVDRFLCPLAFATTSKAASFWISMKKCEAQWHSCFAYFATPAALLRGATLRANAAYGISPCRPVPRVARRSG